MSKLVILILSHAFYAASYAKDIKKDFKTDLMGKTEAEVLKARGQPEKTSNCSEYEDLQLKAFYWRMSPPDEKYGDFWHEIIISKKDGKVCSDGKTTGDNCRELSEGSCGLPIQAASSDTDPTLTAILW